MTIVYIDPGTGSMLISAVIALISVGFFMLKGFIYQKLNVGGSKGVNVDVSKPYGLVFYSEGKQYWNVFKPLLEECSKRSIDATYFTSDVNDPGLDLGFEHIDSQFIGNGQEAFYILNHMSADMMIMTTPGLDVLEIKKNKNIKHYCHVTHATSSIGSYKSYSVDYFDSVLLGGDGDLEVISELETKRKIQKKELKIIGHTYLDVYREKLSDRKYNESFFDNNKPVVLLSPTWGNHGLLTKYGEKILKTLENSDRFNIIIRPHPQSFLSEEKLMKHLMTLFPDSHNRIWDRNIDGLISMSQADIMISDFSGIIFDFLSLFKKPILTMHGQYEKRGREASDLDEDPWDLRIVEKLGGTINQTDILLLPEIINESLSSTEDISQEISEIKHVFDKNPEQASVSGVDFISEKLSEIRMNEEVKATDKKIDQTTISSNVLIAANKSASVFVKIKEMFITLMHPSTILQMFLALFLLTSYIFIGKQAVPQEGLNHEFLSKLLSYSIALSIIVFIVLIFTTWLKNKGTIYFKKRSEKIDLLDFLLVTLPMTPIIQYIVANQDILSFVESSKVFLFFLFVSLVVVVLIPLILSPILSKSLSTPISLGILFVTLNMADFGKTTSSTNIGIILLVLFVAVFLLMFFNKKNLYIVASVIFLITNIGTSYFNPKEIDDTATEDKVDTYNSRILELTAGKTPVNTPDVFLLIYESYSNQETMDLYGFDNSDHIQYLLDAGFAVYDGTYSLGPSSLESMARVLEPDYVSSDVVGLREAIVSESASLKLFNSLDYTTHAAIYSTVMTSGVSPEYDYFFPDARYSIDPHRIIIDAILEGEFRFDADFSTIDYESYVDYKQNVLSRNLSNPEFLYAHNDLPGHSQNSGILRPDETNLHFEGIKKANKEMQADMDAIKLKNRDAIVIVAGDHGPYLTKNGIGLSSYDLSEISRLDIQDRYGSFLAIHWPDSTYEEKYDIQILQDVIPAVVAYMYEDDSLFDKTRMDRKTFVPSVVSGAIVKDGIIEGGSEDGFPLFEKTDVRSTNN